jgi:hypothetical protein
MKTLLILLLIVTGISNAQETEFTFTSDKGMTDFIVIPVEGRTAHEIYKKVIEWIKVTYKNPDKVILSTIENEYVRFEGSSASFYSINMGLLGTYYQETTYQIEISIKDDKYKFDIISMQNYTSPSQYTKGGWNDNVFFNGNMSKENLSSIYKKDGSFRSLWKNLPLVPPYFNDLNKSLIESINSTVKKTDGW